jgi:pSer/pThr/pTyr-binding forkhead associated (FHA) protein
VIQFQLLSGKQAGGEIVVRHFPFSIGRGAEADLPLDEPGVWEHHVHVEFRRGEGFAFSTNSQALTLVNGARVESGLLRNGDVIELGSTKLRFWLAPSKQKSLRVREALTWTGFFALFGGQIALIYWLLS